MSKHALLIQGDVAGRKIIYAKKPAYPQWLNELAEEPEVTIYYEIRPDGTVADKIRIIKSSGYDELDNNAISALLQFRFESLVLMENQVGYATFVFKKER